MVITQEEVDEMVEGKNKYEGFSLEALINELVVCNTPIEVTLIGREFERRKNKKS